MNALDSLAIREVGIIVSRTSVTKVMYVNNKASDNSDLLKEIQRIRVHSSLAGRKSLSRNDER